MRYLALDIGDKRTGVALGDSVTRIATPVGSLEIPLATGGGEVLLAAIQKAAEEHLGPAGEVVIGLPLNMDGTEGPRAKLVRELAARIQSRLDRAVHLHDERLTSAAADWSMARSGLTHKQKKQRRDALAAAAMLHDFLAGRADSPDT